MICVDSLVESCWMLSKFSWLSPYHQGMMSTGRRRVEELPWKGRQKSTKYSQCLIYWSGRTASLHPAGHIYWIAFCWLFILDFVANRSLLLSTKFQKTPRLAWRVAADSSDPMDSFWSLAIHLHSWSSAPFLEVNVKAAVDFYWFAAEVVLQAGSNFSTWTVLWFLSSKNL